ncbi:P-loop NTPase [Rhodococcus sp. BS-15]|uniref:P-loop NTPase n=1 Tax=Rhodococcus sp. BS-15 TaxID=1304954 RepID=UPI000FFC65D3|nr:P-loop NTPase [Rhodococcus sp. BS-15]
MPTNVSTPIWRCDLCNATFGHEEAAAAECEGAPIPAELPAGTPLLVSESGIFRLRPLAATGRIDTDMKKHPRRPGHHRCYNPLDAAAAQWFLPDRELHPAKPGYVQGRKSDRQNTWMWNSGASGGLVPDMGEWSQIVGLGQRDSPVRDGDLPASLDWSSSVHVVNPITGPVKELLDALDVQLDYPWQQRKIKFLRDYALYRADGDVHSANGRVATESVVTSYAALVDEWQQWRSGANVATVLPQLETRSTMTASRLTKPIKALVENTGVSWPARTTATQYVNLLVSEALVTTLSAQPRMFGSAPIVAVGGGKGGVGKSTVAAALARSIAAGGRSVVLIDLDMDGPSQHLLHDLGDVRIDASMTKMLPTEVADGLRVFSHGQLPHGLPERWTDAATGSWLTFLGATLDVDGADLILLDLPAGHGSIPGRVIGSNRPAEADVLIAVTTAEELALADASRELRRYMHDHHKTIVVENLSHATGTTSEGRSATVRLHGRDGAVQDLAASAKAEYGGSLPWSDQIQALAESPEMAALSRTVTRILEPR